MKKITGRKGAAKAAKAAAKPGAPAPHPDHNPRGVALLSDSTGDLAIHQLSTMLTQFPVGTFTVWLANFLTREEDWLAALERARDQGALVVHTTADPARKRFIHGFCEAHAVHCFDLTGPLMEFLSLHSPAPAKPDAAQVHRLDQTYFRRIQAMEFTLTHDDGVELRDLGKADIVLAGVSRTSKTPISIFLANKGFKVINVPLVMENGVPAALEAHAGGNVVGLILSPSRLQAIRAEREKVDGVPPGPYSDPARVRAELAFARALYVRKGWPVWDATHSSVEESAWHVLKLLRLTPFSS